MKKTQKSRAEIIIDTIKISGEKRLAICDIIFIADMETSESKFVASTCLRLVESGKLSRRKIAGGLWGYSVRKGA